MVHVKLEWFCFEESYLLSVEYNPVKCLLVIGVDARISVDYPSKAVNTHDDYYEEIEVILNEVQHFEVITNTHLRENPNDDIGNIEVVEIISPNLNEVYLTNKIILGFFDGTRAEVASVTKEIKFMKFISDMLAFQVGFEELGINKRI